MPLSRGCGFGSHISVAKHGCDSFVVGAMTAAFGSRNEGSGGGGIDSMVSGGGGAIKPQLPTQFPSILEKLLCAVRGGVGGGVGLQSSRN